MKRLFTRKTGEYIFIGLLLFIAAFAHGYNMFHFPYFENDEGSYFSYGWAFLTKGELSPYTYWYDHAPAGWLLLALWTVVTGGIFTFGFSLNSGRIFMLILHVLSSLMLYYTGKKLTGSKWVGALSVIIFSLSPLGVYYQRRILLDNIMVFWSLASLLFLLYQNNKLRNVIFSAITFGISVLSKENAVFFAPVYLYLIYAQTHARQRIFALVKWIVIVGIVISLYFLYALIKGELFPSGTLFGGTNEHVSLIETLKFQADRDGGSIFDMEKSDFWHNMRVWLGDDPFIIIAGAGATIINMLVGLKVKSARIAGWLSALMWFFLLRGGVVLELYILPLIPIMALNIAIVGWIVQKGIQWLGRNKFVTTMSYVPQFALAAVVIVSSMYYATNVKGKLNLYTSDQITPQMQAIDWILSNERPNAMYVIDNYALIDLWVKNNNNFSRADWYWKVDKDKDVAEEVLNGKPDDIDYIAMTPQMDRDISAVDLDINRLALQNAKPIQRFWNDGWGVEFWATLYPQRILESSWESYKKHFVKDGRTIDLYKNNETTAESQAYTLLRAVWMNDKETFDSVYGWTKENLQQSSGVFSWKWNTEKQEIVNATDADQDIALALLFAHKRWGGSLYKADAERIIDAIWRENIVVVKNTPYVTAGNWADHRTAITINPSYLSPAAYRIFATVDSLHSWDKVITSSYEVLGKCTTGKLDKKTGVLPPNWCTLQKSNQQVVASQKPQPVGTEYGYNAFRVPWRIALDYQWYKSPQAKAYLSRLSVLKEKWEKDKKLVAAYQHDGNEWEKYESVAAYGGNLGYFVTQDKQTAEVIYKTKVLHKFYEDADKSYWDDPKNSLMQNWGWFGTAMYANKLPNLWEVDKSAQLASYENN